MARRSAPLALIALALVSSAKAEVPVNINSRNFTIGVTSYRDLPFRTVVRQQYDYSCGSAAVATLLRFHFARPIGEADVFQSMYAKGDQARIRKVGFSMLDLKRFLESEGLQADGFRISLDQLARSAAPVITVITVEDYRHFVVVKGVRDGVVLVGDPASGLRRYALTAFAEIWNGVVLAARGPHAPRFNREDEWRSWPAPPLSAAFGGASIAALTRELPPIYQIAPALPPIVSPR